MNEQHVIVEGRLAAESGSRVSELFSSLNSAVPRVAPAGTSSQVLSFDGRQNRIVFASLTPKRGDNLSQQLRDVCRQLDAVCAEHGIKPGDVARQSVFLRSRSSRENCREILREFYGGVLPATSFIRQPPANGEHVALEILAFQGSGVRVESISEHLTVVRDT